MIEYRKGDLLAQLDLDYLVHGCNCQNTMGSGIALAIKNKWPEVYDADCESKRGDAKKLGTYTQCQVDLDNAKSCLVINLYQQYKFGEERSLNYEAFYRGMETLKKRINLFTPYTPIVIGLPYKMGCDRAGGSWDIVEAMLKQLFEKEKDIKLVICQL